MYGSIREQVTEAVSHAKPCRFLNAKKLQLRLDLKYIIKFSDFGKKTVYYFVFVREILHFWPCRCTIVILFCSLPSLDRVDSLEAL